VELGRDVERSDHALEALAAGHPAVGVEDDVHHPALVELDPGPLDRGGGHGDPARRPTPPMLLPLSPTAWSTASSSAPPGCSSWGEATSACRWPCAAVDVGSDVVGMRRLSNRPADRDYSSAQKAVGERMVRMIGGETSAVSIPDGSTRPRWEPGPPASPEAPVVSISLPVRDGERSLERAMRSVLDQDLLLARTPHLGVGERVGMTGAVLPFLCRRWRRAALLDELRTGAGYWWHRRPGPLASRTVDERSDPVGAGR
jgi:hypothetical protein